MSKSSQQISSSVISQALAAANYLGSARTRSHSVHRHASTIPDVKTRLIPEPESQRLLDYSELSTWRQQGSEHLQTGYRNIPESLSACLHSWTYVHNESVNIHSHILGTSVFLSLPYLIFSNGIPSRVEVATTTDILVCSVYLFGVAICFSFSTIFHTFMHLSRQSYALGIKLDYCGIILLMWGSTFPLAYYSFPSRAYTQIGYMAVTTILAGLCLLATFHQSVGGPHLGHVRAVLFGSFGLGSFLMPILHGLWLYGLAEQSPRIGLTWIIATALCNGVGVIAYAFKFPEAYCPRRFDIFGASHQIMHIMVVLAALAYAKAVVAAFDHSHYQDTVYQQMSATAHP